MKLFFLLFFLFLKQSLIWVYSPEAEQQFEKFLQTSTRSKHTNNTSITNYRSCIIIEYHDTVPSIYLTSCYRWWVLLKWSWKWQRNKQVEAMESRVCQREDAFSQLLSQLTFLTEIWQIKHEIWNGGFLFVIHNLIANVINVYILLLSWVLAHLRFHSGCSLKLDVFLKTDSRSTTVATDTWSMREGLNK